MKARKATVDLIKAKPAVTPKLMHQARTAVKQFQDLNSSHDAEALYKKDFQLRPIYPTYLSPMQQLKMMNAINPLEPAQYDNDEEYMTFCQKINEARESSVHQSASKKKTKPIEFYKQELEAWLEYVDKKREVLEKHDDFKITDSMKILMKDVFDRQKSFSSGKVPSSRIVDAHAMLPKNKKWQFQIPIEPKCLSQMIHPFQGYMTSFETRQFTWNEMLQTYQIQVVASYEKHRCRHLSGDEFSCLSFYLLVDKERKGYLTLSELLELLHAFKFHHVDSSEAFEKEFAFEISEEPTRKWDERYTRFDLVRRIFLTRGL